MSVVAAVVGASDSVAAVAAVRVVVRMVSGGSVEIQDMPDADVLDVVEDYQQGISRVMSFQLDNADGTAPGVIHVTRAHVESVEVGP